MGLVRFHPYRRLFRKYSPAQTAKLRTTAPPSTALGNKLQRLALQSPADLAIVEHMVDRILARLSEHPERMLL